MRTLGYTLADAAGDLLPAGVPEQWRDAVAHAARILAPHPNACDPELLGTLALTVYTVAAETGRRLDEVPLEQVRAEVSQRYFSLMERCRTLMRNTGHTGDDALERAVGWLFTPGGPVPEFEDGSMIEPARAELAAERLVSLLAGLDDAAVRALPEPPAPTPPCVVHVRGRVCVLNRHTGLMTTVVCTECGACYDGVLRSDGPDVLYVCTLGHVTPERDIDAHRMRNALVYAGVDTRAQNPLLDGDLVVAHIDNSADYNPLDYFPPRFL